MASTYGPHSPGSRGHTRGRRLPGPGARKPPEARPGARYARPGIRGSAPGPVNFPGLCQHTPGRRRLPVDGHSPLEGARLTPAPSSRSAATQSPPASPAKSGAWSPSAPTSSSLSPRGSGNRSASDDDSDGDGRRSGCRDRLVALLGGIICTPCVPGMIAKTTTTSAFISDELVANVRVLDRRHPHRRRT